MQTFRQTLPELARGVQPENEQGEPGNGGAEHLAITGALADHEARIKGDVTGQQAEHLAL